MLMEYVRGREVYAIPDGRERYGKRCAEIVRRLHANDLVHGDVHLRNFMVEDATNKVRVIDISGKRATPYQRAFDKIRVEEHFGIRLDKGFWEKLVRKHLAMRASRKKKPRKFARVLRISSWSVVYLFAAFLWSSKARKAFSQILFWRKPMFQDNPGRLHSYVSYFYDDSLNKRSVNLGDYIQTLAVENAVDKLFDSGAGKEFISVKRDRLVYSSSLAICVMQGWYEQDGLGFLPGKSILPVWVGTHFRGKTRKTLKWLLKFHPRAFEGWEIGCRDLSTMEFCQANGIKAYFSRCLTLTFPKRGQHPERGKVFCVNCPGDIESFLSDKFGEDLEVVNQRACYAGEQKKTPTELKEEAFRLLERYKDEARLIITTALHCAQPCLAMGIPVVFIDPSYDECDRFSSFRNILRIYSVEDLKNGRVDFDCKAPDIEELKKDMLENLRLSILKAQGEAIDEWALKNTRKRIADFRITPLP